MDKKETIKVGISIGDINGIGIEIILKTFKDKRMLDFCTPVIYASKKLISDHKAKLNINTPVHSIRDARNIIPNKLNLINIWQEDVPVSFGEANKTGGTYAFKSLQAVVKDLKSSHIDVMLTAPIHKNTIHSDKFQFKGHTDYLESEFEGKSLMILMHDKLRVALITAHIALDEVTKTITPALIREKVDILYHTLQNDFSITKPKIAILSIDPHAGDDGVIGNVDTEMVKPTIQKLQNESKLVFGPYPADSFFGSNNYKNFDAILAAYHDQGLTAFKTISFGHGVNYTAGLNIVRTSPDHGTAFDIAGKGEANYTSFKEALFAAIDIYKKRIVNMQLRENALK